MFWMTKLAKGFLNGLYLRSRCTAVENKTSRLWHKTRSKHTDRPNRDGFQFNMKRITGNWKECSCDSEHRLRMNAESVRSSCSSETNTGSYFGSKKCWATRRWRGGGPWWSGGGPWPQRGRRAQGAGGKLGAFANDSTLPGTPVLETGLWLELAHPIGKGQQAWTVPVKFFQVSRGPGSGSQGKSRNSILDTTTTTTTTKGARLSRAEQRKAGQRTKFEGSTIQRELLKMLGEKRSVMKSARQEFSHNKNFKKSSNINVYKLESSGRKRWKSHDFQEWKYLAQSSGLRFWEEKPVGKTQVIFLWDSPVWPMQGTASLRGNGAPGGFILTLGSRARKPEGQSPNPLSSPKDRLVPSF